MTTEQCIAVALVLAIIVYCLAYLAYSLDPAMKKLKAAREEMMMEEYMEQKRTAAPLFNPSAGDPTDIIRRQAAELIHKSKGQPGFCLSCRGAGHVVETSTKTGVSRIISCPSCGGVTHG